MKWHRRFLELARFISEWSYDPSTKTGAVIVTPDRRIVSTGYNGFAKGVKDDPERYADRELKYKLVVHCERNAILFANRDQLQGATLYTYPFMSCSVCAGFVIQAGIARCVAPQIPEDKRARWAEDMKLSEMQFREAGVELIFLDLEDPRKTALKMGLRQLTVGELYRVMRYRDDLLLDDCNYKDGKFCPLAVALEIPEYLRNRATDELVLLELKHRGYTVYNTRGVEGDFYTTNRKRDLAIAVEEVIREKLNEPCVP